MYKLNGYKLDWYFSVPKGKVAHYLALKLNRI